MRKTATLFLMAAAVFAPLSKAQVRARGPAAEGLRVASSGRYFETKAGKPWFWLGDTAWSMLSLYTPEEAEIYLDARAKEGFTIIQTVAIWDGGTGTESGERPNRNTAHESPWIDKDPLRPNEAYWKTIDRILAHAGKDGLYLGLLPAWGSFVVDLKMITAENARQYGKWVGERYRNAPNLIWIVGGDRRPNLAPEIWDAIAEGLREGDGGTHLLTFHPSGGQSSSALRNPSWLAANMIQTWAEYTNIVKFVKADYALTPPKPVILGEGAYEDGPEYPTKPITPLVVRKQAYWAYLNGGSFTYGHNDMWRKNPTWKESLGSPGARNMTVLAKVFGQLSWWKLVPDETLLANGAGEGKNRNAAARGSDNDWALIYLSSNAKTRVKSPAFGKKAYWINPSDGRKTPAHLGSGETVEVTPPVGWEDALLLFRSR